MKQRGQILMYLVLALAVIAGLYGLYALVDANWETSAGVKKGESKVRAEWSEAVQEQRDKEEKQGNTASAGLEGDREKTKVVFRTVNNEVEKIVERSIYRDRCLDDDGLRIARCAIRGQGADSCKPDQPMHPAPGTSGRNGSLSIALDYGRFRDL